MNDRPDKSSEKAPHDEYKRNGQNLQVEHMVMGTTGGWTPRRTDGLTK